MKKIIRISNKDYEMASSAFTLFSFKDETGKNLLDVLSEINKKQKKISEMTPEEQEEAWLSEIGYILDDVLHLAFVMYKEADKTATNFNDFARGIDNILDDDGKWIMEVVELGISPFSGNLQASK